MIDDWLINPRRFIKIEYAANNAYVKDVNSGRLYIDVSYAPKLFYISPTGKAVQTNLVHMLLHELGHALTTKKDNIGIIDYKGDNVRFTNPMLTQLGIPERLSYNATDYESSLGGVLERNFEYTNGASIDRAQIGDRNLSMTPLTLNSKDLLIGGPSANILQSSFGDDYLWGAGGDDQLYGGGGTDMVGYMGKAIDYDVRLNPDDTWMVRHARGEKNEGTDIVINAEKILFKDGKTFDLKKKGLSYQSDFALVIDTTGSMGDDIDAVKRQGAAIINALFSDDTRDARVGIIGFKDTTIGEPSSVLLPFTDQDQFSDRRAAALNALNSIGVGGGGDLPETAFDGLLKAFSPAMGGWRPGAGLSRIVLFTDAPAKDSTLQSQVNKLASNISATITPGLRGIVGSGMIETMTLSPKISSGSDKSSFFPGSGDEDPDLPPFTFIEESPTPDTSTASLEIYTIYTGNSGSIDPDLKSIALSTGGDSFNAPNPDDLVETLLSIIDLPADLPKFLLTGSATELWEGDRLAVSLTSSKVPSGTPLYWSLTGSGITASDFPDGITTGVGVVGADGRYSFSRVLALDSLSDPNESLDV